MIATVISKSDEASVCIGRELISLKEWEELDNNIYLSGDRLLCFIDDMHLYRDNIDKKLKEYGNIEAVVFASRHSSESGRRTLSVHPIGNFGEAKFGGKSRELVISAPLLMRSALKTLQEKAKGMDYEVCYEVTHHGPHLSTPAFFIETGSTEREWNDREACRAIAETIMEMEREGGMKTDIRVGIGVGGGHYAPRFTDIALHKNVAFGHMIPDYHLPAIDDEMIKKAIEATPDAKYAYFHGKKSRKFKKIFEDMGMECILK
ncbi:MAG: hypothetical protein DRN33_01360 [Thermoplasmata archaeon]|nr:MAG: hypothetical protein DRN33_01360 [Thermoplasmata archaeon]